MNQLIITFDENTGAVNVNGPITNRGMCYLMLEMARDAIKDYVPPNVLPTQLIDGETIRKLRKRG